MSKFNIGDKIYKPKGYKFDGTVVSVFNTTLGDIRIVAEMDDNGMLHIFNENQLEIRDHSYDYGMNEHKFRAMELVNYYVRERNMTSDEAKNHILDYKILFEVENIPEFIREYWSKIKEELIKL